MISPTLNRKGLHNTLEILAILIVSHFYSIAIFIFEANNGNFIEVFVIIHEWIT